MIIAKSDTRTVTKQSNESDIKDYHIYTYKVQSTITPHLPLHIRNLTRVAGLLQDSCNIPVNLLDQDNRYAIIFRLGKMKDNLTSCSVQKVTYQQTPVP